MPPNIENLRVKKKKSSEVSEQVQAVDKKKTLTKPETLSL